MKAYVGIDVGKEHLDIAVLSCDGELKRLRVANTAEGHKKLLSELSQTMQVIIEVTGTYHRQLERSLIESKIATTIINPRQAMNYAKSRNRRNKTDKVDALLLAEFGLERQPQPNTSLAPARQTIARELEALDQDLSRLRNRLEAAEHGLAHSKVIASIKRRIKLLEEEKEALKEQLQDDLKAIKAKQLELLQSIPGIGLHTACLLLAEIGNPLRFKSARSLVAFSGLSPMLHESGKTSRYTAISRMGSAHLRHFLYMPSVAASRWNPVIKAFYERLVAKGKPKMVALVACMAKLLRVVFGVLKSNKPFDPAFNT